MRPEGYFKRFQAAIEVIRSSIESKACKGRWVSGIGRTRQGHWLRALLRGIKAYLTDGWSQGVLAGFDCLYKMGRVPVSRAI